MSVWSGNGGDPAAALREAVARQRDLYGQLDALSQRQRALIEAGEAERLLALVREREGLVAALLRGAERLGELLPAADGLATAERTSLLREVEALQGLARAVAVRDAEDAELIVEQRNAVADELAGLGRGRRAVGAYGAAPATGAMFQDRRA